jgi:hypothetical protein
MHLAHDTAVSVHRRTKHQVTLARGTGHSHGRIADHASDLTRLGIAIGIHGLASFDPFSPIRTTTAVEWDREGRTPSVSERAALGRASQVG